MTTGAPMQPPGGGYPQTPVAPKPADPARSAAIMLAIAAVLILVGTASKNWVGAGGGSRELHMGPMGGEACFESRCVSIPTKGIPGDIEAIMVIAWLSGFASAGAAGVFGGMTLAGKQKQIPIPPKLAQVAFGLAAFSMTFFLIRMLSEKADISWAGFPAIGGVILAGVGLKKLMPFISGPTPQQAYQAFMAQQTMPSVPPGQHGNQSQPMQPYGQQGSQPYPQAQQSGPMQPYGQQGSQPYPQAQQSGGMQPYAQQGSQPYQQPQMAPPHQPPPQVHNCPRCGTQLQFVAQYQRWYCPREQQYL